MRRPVFLLIKKLNILVMALSLSGFHLFHKHGPEQAEVLKASPVSVARPLVKNLPITVTSTGHLLAEKSTNLTPSAAGYIDAIYCHEGEWVSANQTLFHLDDQAQKNVVESAQANSALSEAQFKRDAQLFKRGFITQETYHIAEVTAKQNLAALKTANTNLSERSIRAPFSGAIGAQVVSLGDYVNPGSILTTLVDHRHLLLAYALPVKYLTQLQLDQAVTLIDQSGQRHSNAIVSYIAPTVDQSTQTIAVHARLDNTNNVFRPGEYVSVTQTLGTAAKQLLIPEVSLRASLHGYSVFVYQDQHATEKTVVPGEHIDGNVVVTSGIDPQDQIIVAGQEDLRNHQSVRVVNSSE